MSFLDRFRRPALPSIKMNYDAPMVYTTDGRNVHAVKLWGNNNNFVNFAYGAYSDIPINSTPVGYAYASIASVWAMRCIEVRSKSISRFEPYLYDKRTKKRVEVHPVMTAINRSPQRLFRLHEWSQMIWGETFIWPKINDFEFASDLQWLNNIGMAVDTGAGYIQAFSYTPVQGGVPHIFKPNELAFFKTDNPFNDLRGLSRFESILIDVGIERDMARSMRAFYANESRPGMMLIPEVDLNPVDAQQFMDYWKKNFQGPANANKPVLMPKSIKDVKDMQRPPLEDDVDVRLAIRSEICAAFGVPMAIAGAWDDANYDSVDTQRKSFYEETMIPEADDIASDWTQRILPFFDDTGALELKFDYTHIMALIEDASTKADIANARLATGAITLNEYRASLNMPKVENGEVYYMPAGVIVTKADELGAMPVKPGEPPGQLPGAPTDPAPLGLPPVTPSNEPDPGDPVPAPALAAGKSAAIMLSMAGNPDLMHLQERTKQYVGDVPTEWNKADDFHVTLAYAPSVSDEQLGRLKVALASLDIPDMALSVGGLRTFDDLGQYAIHFRIRRNGDLLDLQESVYDLCKMVGLQMSSYSEPRAYTPHITMGYSKQRPPASTFDGKLTVKPIKMVVGYGDVTAFEKAVVTPELQSTDVSVLPVESAETKTSALDELAAWEKKVKNKGIKSAFQNYLIRDEMAGIIRAALDAAADDKAAVKAVFDVARDTLSIRAIQSTRLDFENAFEDVLAEARAGSLTRTRWASITRQLIRTFGARAFRDALQEAGIDDDPDESEQDTIAALVSDQSQYVTSLGATLFKDEDSISDDMAAQKPAMWYAGSISPFYTAGKLSAQGNAMFTWVLGGAQEHCPDCPKLDGKRARFKTWYRKNLVAGTPGQDTKCAGFQCQCKLVPSAGKSSADLPSLDDLKGWEEHKHPRDDTGQFGQGGGGSSGDSDSSEDKPDKKPGKEPDKKPSDKPSSSDKPQSDSEQGESESNTSQSRDWHGSSKEQTDSYFNAHTVEPSGYATRAVNGYVNDYITTGAFTNMKLRGNEGLSPLDSREKRFMSDLDEVIGENHLPEATTLYRGVTGPYANQLGSLKPGDTFSDGGYGSTSLSKSVPSEDLKENDALIRIHAPKGTNAIYVNSVFSKSEDYKDAANGPYSHQQEVLLKRGAKYRVKNIEREGDHNIINVELTE